MPDAQITRTHLDEHVHSRLRSRVRLYLGIFVLIVLVIAYRLFFEGGNILYSLLALAIGIAVGVIVSRMYAISWDKDSEKVVSRMDLYGGIFLAAYVLVEVTGEHFIREWFTGPEVMTMILSLAGGAVLGRGIGMARAMIRVLRAHV